MRNAARLFSFTRFFLAWTLILAFLQPETALSEEEGNRIYMAPYAWALDLDGTVGLNGLTVPLDVQSTELIKGAKSGGMGYLVWDRSADFFYLEGMQVDFAEKSFEDFFNQSVEASLLYGEIGYGRHIKIENPSIGFTKLRISPYIGVRKIDLWVKVDGPLLSQKVSPDWIDPVVGAYIQGEINNRLSLNIKLDASGFRRGGTEYRGVAGAMIYSFGHHWSVGLGYRYAMFEGTDSSTNGLELDLRGQGPMAGIIYGF